MRYHTLIIGAGMSGLAAGIRLAYYEKPVCILERHSTIGGLNSFYRLRGRNYDVGLHAVTNFAPPGTRRGPLAKLLKQLRLRWDDFALSPQIGSAVVFPGRRLRFSNDFALLEHDVAEQFPREADGFRRLTAEVSAFDESQLTQPPLSARSIVDRFLHDPVLCDMLLCPLMFYGSARVDDMDYSQFCIMFKSIYQQGLARPLEGVRRILRALVRQYREFGGELRLRHGVRQIAIDNGRAVGVVLDDGREIAADNVLSSAGAVETLALCPLPVLPQPRPTPGVISFNEAVFTLDRQPTELGHSDTILFYNEAERFRYRPPEEPCDLQSGIICCPNNFNYGDDGRPLEGCVRLTALSNPAYWLARPEPDYAAQKQAWCRRMAEAAVRHIPDFRPHVIDSDIFTPRTIRRFTGHERGAVYGAPVKVPLGTTDIRGLYLCGTDQGLLGIIGAMLSGIMMANNHLLQQ